MVLTDTTRMPGQQHRPGQRQLDAEEAAATEE